MENAKLTLEGKEYEFPTFIGTEGEKAVDLTSLRAKTNYITFDPGFANTGACKSDITFIDGEKGILHYRGYDIAELAEKSTFTEVAHLLIYGDLPDKAQRKKLSDGLTRHAPIHEDLKNFFDHFSSNAHPMLILSTMISALSSYHFELNKAEITDEDIWLTAVKLISKVRTIAAFSYKKSIGEPFVYPSPDLKFVPNFLNMMFDSPCRRYEVDEDIVRAMEVLFILHADHEQNCSTSTVRTVSSSLANLFSSVAGGIFALWGPLHGGANQAVVEQLSSLVTEKGDYKKFIERAKDKNDNFRLMGFGHRIYKNFDPRAKIIKQIADKVIKKIKGNDPLLDLAMQLEEAALKDDYFIEKKLYPNVDFYSGIIYRAIGFPVAMYPVLFAIGRMPGWIAHWKEFHSSPDFKIVRPRQIYTGKAPRKYIPFEERS